MVMTISKYTMANMRNNLGELWWMMIMQENDARGQGNVTAATEWHLQSRRWIWNDRDEWDAIKHNGETSWDVAFIFFSRFQQGGWIMAHEYGRDIRVENAVYDMVYAFDGRRLQPWIIYNNWFETAISCSLQHTYRSTRQALKYCAKKRWVYDYHDYSQASIKSRQT